MHEKTRFTVGGIPVFLNKEEVEQKLLPVMPEEVLKSLAFDNEEVRGVIAGQLAKTDRENCYWGIYLRGKANVESLLSLKQVRDFQAISMLTRSLFDCRLI